jgi:hypothetical protein
MERPMSNRNDFSRRQVMLGALAMPLVAGLPQARAAEQLGFNNLYKSFGVLGLEFSDQVKQSAGKQVAISGFMAPPLKAEANFFVLTEIPMSICPFCSSDSDWPDNIVVVYLAAKILTRGTLEYGSWTDPETGFVSQLRMRDASFTTV